MKRMVERLAAVALFAAATMVAGCVAQAGDDDESVVESSEQLIAVPETTHPDLPPPGAPDPAPANTFVQKITGGDNAGEPEPNPWKPGTGGPAPGDPGPSNTRH